MVDSLAASPLLPGDKEINTKKLFQALIKQFNESELQTLCFNLDIDYELLPAGNKGDKARGLVQYYKRHRRLKLLAVAIREARPELPWEELTQEKSQSPETDDNNLLAQPGPGTQTLIISKGVTALIRLMRSPEVRAAAATFRSDFEAASAQIDLMNDYKLIHDLFQELENRYFLIYNDQKRLPADEMAWESIEVNEPEVRGKIEDLIQAVNLASFANEEARWTRQLEKVKENVRQGVDQYDFNTLKSGTNLLYRILNRQISRINAQLVNTAALLRLDTLEQAMITISNSLSQADFGQEATSEIQDGVGALSGLDTRVANLVRDHNAWQELDDELRRVEGTLNQGIEELEDAWFDLAPMAHNLYNGHPDEWAIGLSQVCASLDLALKDGTVITIRRLFRRFRSREGRRFRQVDLILLTMVQELQEVGESLDLLLRNFK